MISDFIDKELLLPSPVHELKFPEVNSQQIQLFIKRDDLIHPLISGNKWRKLKYNLIAALEKKSHCLFTVGGAYSNHLVAVAAAGRYLKLKTTGVIFTYQPEMDSYTIRLMRRLNMNIHFKRPKENIHECLNQFVGNSKKGVFLIPEGGSNALALHGIKELMDEIGDGYSHIVIPIGTGGTLAGILNSKVSAEIIAIAPFRNHKFQFSGLDLISETESRFEIINSTLNTRFGTFHPAVVKYCNQFVQETGILLDPIYGAKAMMTLESLIKAGRFKAGSRVLYIHTGGLQGINGYNEKYSCSIQESKLLRRYETEIPR